LNTLKPEPEQGSGCANFLCGPHLSATWGMFSCMYLMSWLELRFGSHGKICQKCQGFWTQRNTKGLLLEVLINSLCRQDYTLVFFIYCNHCGKLSDQFRCTLYKPSWSIVIDWLNRNQVIIFSISYVAEYCRQMPASPAFHTCMFQPAQGFIPNSLLSAFFNKLWQYP